MQGQYLFLRCGVINFRLLHGFCCNYLPFHVGEENICRFVTVACLFYGTQHQPSSGKQKKMKKTRRNHSFLSLFVTFFHQPSIKVSIKVRDFHQKIKSPCLCTKRPQAHANNTQKIGETKNRQLYNYNTLLFKVTASYQLKLIQSRRLIKKVRGKKEFPLQT